MAKIKTAWFCNSCGNKQTKWAGQCSACFEWNTYLEETIGEPARFLSLQEHVSRPLRLKEVPTTSFFRVSTGLSECDRLLGGGLVPGSLTLVGGDPGIGKSTLMLQLSENFAKQGMTVLYVCGEESVEQTTLRASRLSVTSENLFLLNETLYSSIKAHVETINPQILIVDSIQIVYKGEISSAPGSVSQVRETTTELMHLAKSRHMSTFLIGHVTKSGEIAGPRVLEHLVDTVLYFEGDKQHHYRLIRVVKNRFGPTDEIGVFSMHSEGLREVPNPSQLFLEERMKDVIGSVVIPTLEGTRSLLIEAQALVTDTGYSNPSRRSTGIDSNRLSLLLAVLEKRMGFQLFKFDVFVSLAGGIKVSEPAIDLGILMAITSSLKNTLVDPECVLIGEVGLGGEVRSVTRAESRVKEAIHMGFKKCVLPSRNLKSLGMEWTGKIKCIGIDRVEEAIHALF